MIYTQNDSLAELIKKIEILNSPLQKKEKDVAVLDITKTSDNEKTDRHVRNTICHKCKAYGHTKKKCDRHNKIIKQISKLEFEKNIIDELMGIFNVLQKEIDQVTKKTEQKSTNPLKVNKRKRKQKDIIVKLIDNLPSHLKDKKDYLLKLIKKKIIQTYLLLVLSIGNKDTMLRNVEKKKKRKEKIRKKRKN